MFDVNPSLIRFWEQKFDILKPDKNKKGNRLFTPKDVENLKLIYHLVKENGMTLAGAAKRLRQNREGVSRDLEIIEKLQRVRSLLLDVREVLKADDDGREVFVDPVPADWDDTPVLEYGAGSDGEPAGSRLPGESSPGAETIGDRARSVTDTAFRHEADDPTSGSGEGQGTVRCVSRIARKCRKDWRNCRRGDRQRMRSRAGSAVFYPARDSRTASAFPGAALAYGRTR